MCFQRKISIPAHLPVDLKEKMELLWQLVTSSLYPDTWITWAPPVLSTHWHLPAVLILKRGTGERRTETLPACRNACNLSRWKKRETLCVVAVIQLVLWVPRVVYFWELFWRWLPVDAVSAACSKMTTENNKARNECFFTAGACLHDSEGKHRLFGQLQLADEMKAS